VDRAGWSYRKKVVIAGAKIAASLTDFPVAVSLSADPELTRGARPDGADLFFTSANGVKLSHEIERFDSASGALVAWVGIPSLSPGADAELYLYYGNATAADQQDAPGVWTNGFVAVRHLSQMTGDTLDSTANGNRGTTNGPTTGVPGILGPAYDFDNPDDNVYIGSNATLQVSAITLSLWASLDGTPGMNDVWVMIDKRDEATDYADYTLTIGPHATVDRRLDFGFFTTAWDSNTSNTTLPLTTWSYAAVTYTPGLGIDFYENGVPDGHVNDNAALRFTANRPLRLSRPSNLNFGGFDGRMDEARIARVGRSAGWLATEYNNQRDPASFFSLSVEEHR